MDISRRRVALVLGGGGALGAFEGGVYEALHAAGVRPVWLAGTSIGAINAALIAGNAPERRVERLRAFWERVAEETGPWALDSGEARRLHNLGAALWARVAGRPGLYTLALPRLFFDLPGWGRPGLYDYAPGSATLAELVDFARIARGETRLSINATDVETGEAVLLDSRERELTPRHVLASASLMPEFPPLEVDGRLLADGGFSANVPLLAVLGSRPETDLVCIAVDLFRRRAKPTLSVDGLAERRQDLLFANQTWLTVELLRARHGTGSGRPGGGPSAVLVTLSYDNRYEHIAQKIYDYSRRSLADRWRAGRAEGEAALRLLAAAAEPAPGSFTILSPPEPPRPAQATGPEPAGCGG